MLLQRLLVAIFACSLLFTLFFAVDHINHSSATGALEGGSLVPPAIASAETTGTESGSSNAALPIHAGTPAASTIPHSPTPSPVPIPEPVQPKPRPTAGCAKYSSIEPYLILDHSNHLVPPPAGRVTIVCCQTTKGEITVAVHPSWAPLGAQRFLEMVTSGFFSSKVGLFRSMKSFLVQFGLAGDPSVQARYKKVRLADDPSWLPFGPPHRTHRVEVPVREDKHARGTELIWSLAEARQLAVPARNWEHRNVSRYQRGYVGYAGGGKNSRGTQLILAYQSNVALGGGSPWEVPFGQLIGAHSYATIDKWETKYGEKPSQGKIMNRGVSYLEEEFPDLDYITSCDVIKDEVEWVRRLKADEY